jgi:hypothetical protein
MSTTQPSYGPPPHPYGRRSRQVGPFGTVLVAIATTVVVVAVSGALALLVHLGV